MKPTRNRIYCNDCGRVKMLFPSQEKADNFIAFNAPEIISEGCKAPERSYYCSSCGGWHVTKNPNQEYYLKQELHKNRIPIIKTQIRELVHRFNTEYNKEEVFEWKKKMDILKKLYDELNEMEVGLVLENSMAANCINQYEQSVENALKKAIAKQRAAVITPEMTAMFKHLKKACFSLKIDICIDLANLLKTNLVKAKSVEKDNPEIDERLNALNDFFIPERIEIIKELFQKTESLVDTCKFMTKDEVLRSILELQELILKAENQGIAHKHLKGVVNFIKIIEKNLPDSNGGVIIKETKADLAAICEARNKIIVAIDLVKTNRIEQARQTLDVAEALIIGFEDSLEGLQIVEAIEIVKKQIENRTNIISYGS